MTTAIKTSAAIPASAWSPPPPLDLEVREGELCLLHAPAGDFGPLLRACVGLLPLHSGSVEVLGVDPLSLSRAAVRRFRARLGVGLRPGGLTANQTIRMNVITPLLYSGLAGAAEAEARTNEVLDACGLTRWAHHRPDDVPTDIRQGAVLARALARNPELLILEDPLSSVDSARVETLINVCRATVATILIATHRRDAALIGLADRTYNWNTPGET